MFAIKKENGKVTNVSDVAEIQELLQRKKEKHLCGAVCHGLTGKKCPKIFDEEKANISEYDFIDSGYQIINDEGVLEKFVVSECKNFKLVEREQDPASRRKIMDVIKVLYFDTETPQEAEEKLKFMVEQGTVLKRNRRK